MQTEIRIGHVTSKRDEESFFKRNILNMVLGGQFSSRINLNLREDKGYTYGAFSQFIYFKESAYFYSSTSVGLDNTANAIKEILHELNNIRKGITFEELEFAKSSVIRKFPSNFESYRQIAGNLTGKILFSLPDNYFNTYLERIKKITLEEVNETAKETIFPFDVTVLLVGDKTKLIPQLKEAGYTQITEVDVNGKVLS